MDLPFRYSATPIRVQTVLLHLVAYALQNPLEVD